MALTTDMAKTILYVANPYEKFRNLISLALSDNYAPSFYDTMDELLIAAEQEQPDLILCHQCLIEAEQSTALETLLTATPDSKILVYGPRQPIDVQINALKHGARGYFDSSLPISKLDDALQGALHGEVWVERHVISGLIDELSHIPEITQEQRESVDLLTPKELEVSKYVSHGATNKMIAHNMAITERTVKAHLTTIFHKMNITDRLSLAIFFRDLRE
ncbi:MAG: DNA-binding response regulator [Gammaproteobacteria bacterium]|nr:MAG: DNA-binding response regulator [Gammaproteobacteria bacterium]RKZ95746.1 MAG: DNA-binding response regulator [Gammaproteobacteria bacterium]RKZ95973.1 MAG: DNA-binding response regulator [Gammaproteobacteria bacterium]